MTLLTKQKTCKVCATPFHTILGFRNWCSPSCGFVLAGEKIEKAAKVAAAKDKRETKGKLLEKEPRGYWLAKAKKAVQKSRRLEELAKGRGCMSCGRSQQEVTGGDSWKPGGFWDGGHFLSKGAYPELALEPKNVWLQCKTCNGGSGKYARKSHTVNQSFRANLITSEGLELVEWLEGPHALNHYSDDEIKAIEKTHTAKARAIEKANA